MPTMLPARIGSQACSVETPPMWMTASTPSIIFSTPALSDRSVMTISSPARGSPIGERCDSRSTSQ